MLNFSRARTMILIAGAAIIALASMLFVNALTLGDFAQPGQAFLDGRSNGRLVVAFALLIGLVLALFFLLFRTERASGDASRSAETSARGKAEKKRAAAQEGAARTVDYPEKKADGIISHTAGELRTSVEAIQEELEEILDDEAPADREHMQTLYEETDRLAKIIDGMEQLSRAEAGARTLKKEPLQLEQFLNDIIEKTRRGVPDKEVTYGLKCEPGLTMKGDPEYLGRIIGNIADNAARSIRGAGSVTLTAARKEEMIVFSIQDTGTGIKRAHISHIYEHFFRGTGTGIGLGLSIAKELAEACGGKIEVQTIVGTGTTFFVHVPRE